MKVIPRRHSDTDHANPAFAPSTGRVYTLGFATTQYTADRVAVTGGASFETNFKLPDTVTEWKLAVSGSNLVIASN